MNMRKFYKIFLPLTASVCWSLGLLGAVAFGSAVQVASASETESELGKTISIYDKFIGENHTDTETGKLVWDEYATPISQSHVFDCYNVANDKESGYGLVTGDAWGASVSAGDGYITYKIQADEGYLLDGLKFSFTAKHGHQSLPEYYGDKNTNIRVSVSDDNVNYEKVYDLGLQRGFPTSGSMTLREDMKKTVDEYAEGKPFVYLRFDMVHLTFAEVAENHQAIVGDVDKQKIYLHKLGVYLHEVSITATQEAYGERQRQTKTYDYGTKGSVGSSYDIVEYANLTKDSQGNADWGLVPASAWGGTVVAKDGYLVYRLPTYTQYDTQSLYMDITYCLRNLHNANFLVSVSEDGQSFTPFYDFKQENLNVYCAGYSEKKTKTLCLNEYLQDYNFVKVEIKHDETSVFLQNLGSLLHKIQFRSIVTEKPAYIGGLFEDYSAYAMNDSGFAQKAFDMRGMQIKQTGQGSGLGNFADEEGYIVYKIQANEGESFSAMNLGLQVRFANVEGLRGECVDLALGYDGVNFTVLGSVEPVGEEELGYAQFCLDEKILGTNTFYLKLQIRRPNESSKTTICSLKTFVSEKYAIKYELNGGDSVGENPNEYLSEEGVVLQKAYKEGYYFVGWYLDEECTRRKDVIAVGEKGDITLYAKFMKAENKAQTVWTEESGCNGSISLTAGLLAFTVAGTLFVKKKRK